MEPHERIDPKILRDLVDAPRDLKHHNLDWILVSSDNHNFPGANRFKPRRKVYYIPSLNAYAIENSRQRRKNRHFEFVHDDAYWKHFITVPGLLRLLALDLKNVSWQVAAWFLVGSALFVVNGHVLLWPINGDSESTASLDVVGYTGLVGGMMFQLGAYLGVVEALNEDATPEYEVALRDVMTTLRQEGKDVECFVRRELQDYDKYGMVDSKYANRDDDKVYVGRLEVTKRGKKEDDKHVPHEDAERGTGAEMKAPSKLTVSPRTKWRWIGVEPCSYGWWASTIQCIGATAYSVSVIAAFPGVLDSSQWLLSAIFVWTMQVIGSICFVTNATMLILEEQRKWYVPSLNRIGWHAAFWNLIGSIGFLLSGSFGYLDNWRGNGTVCCFFWGVAFNLYYGSYAFFVSSALMLIEAQNKELISFDKHVARLYSWIAAKTGWYSKLSDKERTSSVWDSREDQNGRT